MKKTAGKIDPEIIYTMTAEKNGGSMYSEYKELALDASSEKRAAYWSIAKGLQAADKLKTSEYLETVIKDNISGKYDTQEAVAQVDNHYRNSESSGSAEADKSSARIALALERGGFKFSPITLKTIHRDLFEGVFPEDWVGVWRIKNLEKEEKVLKGRSVQYANYLAIEETLRYDFDEEKRVTYSLPFSDEQILNMVRFTSNIWQTHPFREGNTRTVATFTIMRLQSMGIDITNEPFAKHSEYFRDALVRANYSNIKEGINEDQSFLLLFFENLLRDENHDLAAVDLVCHELSNTSE